MRGILVFFGAWLVTLPLAGGTEADSAGDLPSCRLQPREQDEFWLLTTRHLPDLACGATTTGTAAVYRYQGESGWKSAELADLFDGAAQRPTVFYVHGNRAVDSQAQALGWEYYEVLASAAGPQSFRFVIWSWPSQQQTRGLRDLRLKAERTDTEAWYLASVLAPWDRKSSVGLIGYSYGARVIGGALHLLEGGELDGRKLPAVQDVEPLRRMRVVLLAAATHHDWLAPGGVHERAMLVTNQLVVLFNPCDPALRRYDLVFRCEHPLALGAVGLDPAVFGTEAARVRMLNVSREVGRTHDEPVYLHAPTTRAELPSVLPDATP